MKLSEICNLLGTPVPGVDRQVNILLTDSRSLSSPDASLFFALRTEAADGADFIPMLYASGVRAFVVHRDYPAADTIDMPDATFIHVGDTLGALQLVGASHRDGARSLVAVTGSRGKTVLKEWLFQLLSPSMSIVRSPRSFNSRIGVPLSLWQIEPGTDLALIEAGISRAGEMAPLRDIIRPDTVIITNIGPAHSEGFRSADEKADEKVSLAAGPATRLLIYCADDPVLAGAVARLKAVRPELDTLGWSSDNPDAPLHISYGDNGTMTYRWQGGRHTLRVPFASPADRQNAGHALALMLSAGIGHDTVAMRLPSLTPVGTRLNVTEGVNGCSLIYDSYTGDLGSLRPALDFMRRRATPGQRPVVVLSDLRHEVADDETTCRAIARMMSEAGVSRLIGVGPVLSAHRALFAPGSRFFASTDELMRSLSPGEFNDEIILVKGTPEYRFDALARQLEARTHETVLEVNLDAVVDNYNYFRSFLPHGTGMVAMVKASGYGAGSYEIAKTLQDCGAAYLAVAVLDEGIDLRRQGITMPIMVMNPRVVNYGAMFAHRLEPEIYSLRMLRDVIAEARRCGTVRYPVHIKLDTGMHRMGMIREELPEVMDLIAAQQGVEIRSVFSHLATADCPDMDDYTRLQLDRFEEYTSYMMSRARVPFLRHVLNSAGILRFPEAHYDMARLGIGLYGVETLPPDMEKPLAQVSALRTVIVAIREWQAGESIGYGRRTILQRPTRVATIPVGYADGMNRHFGCGAVSVRVAGKDAPTLGNICMDACMIDVTGIDCEVGDTVEIFGPEAPVSRLSDLLGTIPYEILTSVSPRVKRVYYRE